MRRRWIVLAGALIASGCGTTDGGNASGGNAGVGGMGGEAGAGGLGGAGGALTGCVPGAIVATAWIDVRSVSETEFSTDGVIRAFTCNGEDFLAKRTPGSNRLQVVVDDGVDDDTIGSNIPTFGIATTDEAIFAQGSQVLQCSPSIPPTILCLSFDFLDSTGSPAFPSDSVFVTVY